MWRFAFIGCVLLHYSTVLFLSYVAFDSYNPCAPLQEQYPIDTFVEVIGTAVDASTVKMMACTNMGTDLGAFSVSYYSSYTVSLFRPYVVYYTLPNCSVHTFTLIPMYQLLCHAPLPFSSTVFLSTLSSYLSLYICPLRTCVTFLSRLFLRRLLFAQIFSQSNAYSDLTYTFPRRFETCQRRSGAHARPQICRPHVLTFMSSDRLLRCSLI